MEHKTKSEKELKRLAKELSDLRYDSLAEFLCALAAKIHSDSMYDELKNRMLLSKKLTECVYKLLDAKRCIDEAWIICKPKMKLKHSKKVSKAIKAAYDELSAMPKAKLLTKLAKHRNGDIAKLLIKAKVIL